MTHTLFEQFVIATVNPYWTIYSSLCFSQNELKAKFKVFKLLTGYRDDILIGRMYAFFWASKTLNTNCYACIRKFIHLLSSKVSIVNPLCGVKCCS